MDTHSPFPNPTRFLVAQNVFSLINLLSRAIPVQDWTDLGSGDGTSVCLATDGIPLKKRTAVLLASRTPLPLKGWNIIISEVKHWVDSLNGAAGDCVSMFDVIEHFDRKDAEDLLGRLERLFRVVVLFTPRGFLRQDATTDPNLKHDPLMWHRCGFTENDFAKRGYLTFFGPIFHFPSTQSPHGAVLAIRIIDASTTQLERLRTIAVREHRRCLIKSSAFRLFLTRLVARKIGGQKALHLVTRQALP